MDDVMIWSSPPDAFPTTAAWAKDQPYETKPPLVRIGAADLLANLRHVAVYRDVYYRDAEKIYTRNSFGGDR